MGGRGLGMRTLCTWLLYREGIAFSRKAALLEATAYTRKTECL